MWGWVETPEFTPPKKIFLKPVKSCKFSIIFRCPPKNGQLTLYHINSFRCLNSQLIDMLGELSTPQPFPLSNFIFSSRGARKNSYLDEFTAIFTVPEVSVRVVSVKKFSSNICLLSKCHKKIPVNLRTGEMLNKGKRIHDIYSHSI